MLLHISDANNANPTSWSRGIGPLLGVDVPQRR